MSRMIMNRLVVGVISMGALVGASCSPSESADLQTSEMRATFVATAQGSGFMLVRATLRSSSGDVKLTGGDRLRATTTNPVTFARNTRRLLSERRLVGVSYVRFFLGKEKDTTIQISLDRSSTDNVTASDSSATMPTPFTLHWVTSPITREPVPLDFSRSSRETRFVVWDPADVPDFELDDVLRFSVTGDCIEPYSGIIDWEQGEDALELTNVLRDREAPNDGQTCAIEIEVKLSRNGSVDSKFSSGIFVTEQVRVLTLLARP